MPAQDFFTRHLPEFARQAGSAQDNAGRQADAERLLAKAEYECIQVRRELMTAMAVPLRDRAVEVAALEDAAPPAEVAPDAAPGAAKAA